MTLYSATFITDHAIRLYRFDTVIMDYINIYTLYMTYLSLSHTIFLSLLPTPSKKGKQKPFSAFKSVCMQNLLRFLFIILLHFNISSFFNR